MLDARDSGLTIEAEKVGQTTLYGGRLVSGWRRDGEKFWCADLAAVKEGSWDLRMLEVNGRMADPARMPESGTFQHQSPFAVQWLSSVAGGWARPPTADELTTLRYDPKDLPATLETRNAEVRVYHMWDECRVGVISNDVAQHTLILQRLAKPPGAFGVSKYVVFNTREGMTKPGQWYLDRVAGRVVYWPLPGEDMTQAKVVAPVLERIISIAGTSNAPVERITVRGLALQATTTPLKPGGFAAEAFDGALGLEQARRCVLENLEIANVAGQGILGKALADCEIRDCRIHDTGGCAIRANGIASLIARNHLHHVGLIYPSATALVVSGVSRDVEEKGFHIYRNEIHDAPYSGMDCRGAGYLIEENLVYRVMREVSDGGAIYGVMHHSIVRGNCVRDVIKAVEGSGVSSYYLDEGSEDCVIKHNVSVGIERPILNHISHGIIIRDNVFIAATNMTLYFGRSSDCTFAGNTLFVPGKITIQRPPAITLWTNNIIFHDSLDKGGSPQAFTIDDAMPSVPPPGRRTSPISVGRVSHPPILEDEISLKDWPGGLRVVDRGPARWEASGAPAFVSLSYDDQCLYVAVKVVLFDVNKLRKGSIWGQDDGAEICIAGDKGTFVIRGFANGMLQSVTDGGMSAEAAARLGSTVRFAAKSYGEFKKDWKSGVWRGEWAIPLDALGIKPSPGLKVPFNIGIYRAEDGVRCCLEGTLAEDWRLDQAAMLQFK
ncbi:MAG: hypothetical protein JWR19_804 [Pedosphaera sp.]|nr:hypothetical protein [Pedosphaera sp.]